MAHKTIGCVLGYVLLIPIPLYILYELYLKAGATDDALWLYFTSLLAASVTVVLVLRFRLQPLYFPVLSIMGIAGVFLFFGSYSYPQDLHKMVLVGYAVSSSLLFSVKLPLNKILHGTTLEDYFALHEIFIAILFGLGWYALNDFSLDFTTIASSLLTFYSLTRITSITAVLLAKLSFITKAAAIAIMMLPLFIIGITLPVYLGYLFFSPVLG